MRSLLPSQGLKGPPTLEGETALSTGPPGESLAFQVVDLVILMLWSFFNSILCQVGGWGVGGLVRGRLMAVYLLLQMQFHAVTMVCLARADESWV